MKLKISWTIFCLLVMSACSFKKDDAEKPKAAAEPVVVVDVVDQIKSERAKEASNGQLTSENVEVSFVEAEMGFYEMTIKWPADIPKVLVVVGDEKQIVLDSNSVKMKVSEGSEVTVELTSHDSFGAPISMYTSKHKAPSDVVISSPVFLVANTTYEANRLYILSDGYIVTNGHHLNISVGKLYVEEAKDRNLSLFSGIAKIRTQIAQNFGNAEFKFRNSSIVVTAKKAVGTLSVALIGFDGRHGLSGAEIELQNKVSRQRDIRLDGAAGTDEVVRRLPKTPDSPAEVVCSRGATNGQDGKQGAPGTDGGDGQNGGDTGNLLVTIDDYSEFALEVGTQVGRGGKGGLGTPGHEGGNGGAPGKSSGACGPLPQPGKKGAPGLNGRNGADGVNGNVGTISSNSAKQKIFDLNVTQVP